MTYLLFLPQAIITVLPLFYALHHAHDFAYQAPPSSFFMRIEKIRELGMRLYSLCTLYVIEGLIVIIIPTLIHRFPCCGKAYPCDVCHDSKKDHPMERANRMICGYCSQEQVRRDYILNLYNHAS